MSQLLREFQQDIQLRQEVYGYLLGHLKTHAADLAMDGKPTAGIKDAKDALDSAFNDLEVLYGQRQKKIINNPMK